LYIRVDTVDDAMRRAYRHLLISGQAINPSRGPAAEITAAVLRLTNPRARLSRTESRGRLFSALGEFLWYLAKTDELAFIRYYMPDYQNSSDDGKTIFWAANCSDSSCVLWISSDARVALCMQKPM
jgi:thymidylate synthase